MLNQNDLPDKSDLSDSLDNRYAVSCRDNKAAEYPAVFKKGRSPRLIVINDTFRAFLR